MSGLVTWFTSPKASVQVLRLILTLKLEEEMRAEGAQLRSLRVTPDDPMEGLAAPQIDQERPVYQGGFPAPIVFLSSTHLPFPEVKAWRHRT